VVIVGVVSRFVVVPEPLPGGGALACAVVSA
jgi:hypothetical protein